MNWTLKINSRNVLRFLLCMVAAIAILNVLWQFLYVFFDDKIFFISTIAWWFNMDYEGTIPSAYSSLMLLVCAFLLGLVAFKKLSLSDKFARHWVFLSGLFAFASWDEATQIHEKLIYSDSIVDLLPTLGIEQSGAFAFGFWTIFVMPIIFLIGLFYIKFFFSLPKKQRRLFLIGIVLFLSGAIATELVNSWIWDTMGRDMEAIPYILSTTVEETLEKLGVTVFIYALLDYLEQLGNINVKFDSK